MYLDTQLAFLYAGNSMQLEVVVPRIQKHTGITDCGIFAAAVATAIAVGDDPVYLTWNQKEIREHYLRCIETETVTPFPSKTRGIRTGKIPLPYRYTIDCICDCNLPEFAYVKLVGDTTLTVQCDGCGFWYHNRCYNLPNTSFSGPFKCKNCAY